MTQPDAPESGRSQFTEAPRQKQTEWSKIIQGIPGYSGLKELISHPRDRLYIPRAGTIAKATSLVVAAGIVVHGLPFFEKFTNNLNLGPQQAAAERLQEVSNRIEFDIGPDHYTWLMVNAGWGRPPYNNPEIRTGTYEIAKNGQYLESTNYFQGLQELYPKPLVALTAAGGAVSVVWDKYYLITGTLPGKDGNYDLHVETGEGVLTPYNYTGRKKMDLDIPGGNMGFLIPASTARDEKGNVLRLEVRGSVDPDRDGTYEYRLDEQGNIVSSAYKVSNSTLTHKVFLPYTAKGAN